MERAETGQDVAATSPPPRTPSLPNGNIAAKLDGGRVKLPPAYTKYLECFPDKTVFVTTIDEITVRVYPRTNWKSAAQWLKENVPKEMQKRVWTRINYYGADCLPDAEGRITIPQQLRTDLKLDKVTVYLSPQNGDERFDLIPQAVLDRDLADSREHRAADVATLESLGMP
jgi:DNA-binding transcriptional regulator/RsmH inhibitor MraZ